MFLQVVFGVVLFLGCLCPVHITSGDDYPPPPETDCEDAAVEAFASSLYTALILSNHPIIFELKVTGEEASEGLYKVVLDELDRIELCNAPTIAKIVSRGAAAVDTFPAILYFYLKGYTVGYWLLEKNLLNCRNAVELALTYFNMIQPVLEEGDPAEMGTYFTGVTRGLVNFVEHLKQDQLDSSIILAFNFYEEFLKHADGL